MFFNQITLHSSRLEVLEAKFDSLSLTLAAAQLKIMNAISAKCTFNEEETRIEKDFDSHPAGCSNLHHCLHSSSPAADTANGAKIFSANCAACHMGGRNVVAAAKTLKKDALESTI